MEVKALTSRKRLRSVERLSNDTHTGDGQETKESPESSTSQESKDSMLGKIPKELSKWKEEHIQSLGIVVNYAEKMTPLELLAEHTKQKIDGADTDCINELETYFTSRCVFHLFLDKEFSSLKPKDARNLRDLPHSCAKYIDSKRKDGKQVPQKLTEWLHRSEISFIQFAENLYYTVFKRENDLIWDEKDRLVDPLSEYDFQYLFDDFVNIFNLKNFRRIEPFLRDQTLQLPKGRATGKADILYCQDITDFVKTPWQDLTNVIAICKIKKHYKEAEQAGENIKRLRESPRVSSSSTHTCCMPPHLSSQELGQFGGELLLYSQWSIFTNVTFGILVQETKVSFAALKITKHQYDNITNGKKTESEEIKPTLTITKPYDFMKKEDRLNLIKPFLQLAMIQEKRNFWC